MRSVARLVVVVVVVVVLVVVVGVGWCPVRAERQDNVQGQEGECCEPQHVHLTLGEAPDHIRVTWATRSPCHTAQVMYGTSPWRLESKVKATSENLTTDPPFKAYSLRYVYTVTLAGLLGGSTYFYRPLCNRMGSGPFFFRAPHAGTEWSPQVLVTGQLGPNSELLPLLSQRALTGQYSATLQLGGLWACSSHSNVTRGDQMMQALQTSAAFLPFMPSAADYSHKKRGEGEEEEKGQACPALPSQLFPPPGSELPSPSASPHGYSFDLGPVHFVSLNVNSDLDLDPGQRWRWLEADLRTVNGHRVTTPWVIVLLRHPLYCCPSQHIHPQPQCHHCQGHATEGLEDLLYRQGVDLVLQSHHTGHGGYRRLYPLHKGMVVSANYTNPRVPVHLVMGTATPPAASPLTPSPSPSPSLSSSSQTPFPAPSHSSVKPEAEGGGGGGGGGADRMNHSEASMIAFRMDNGTEPTYGRLHIINNTHMHWELLRGGRGGAREGGGGGGSGEEVLDTFWLVQETHGPFHLNDLPQEARGGGGSQPDSNKAQDDGGGGGVYSHQQPAGGEDDADADAADDVLSGVVSDSHRRQLVLGLCLGAAVLLVAVSVITCALRHRASLRRRGLAGTARRRWDSSDCKYGKTRLSNHVDDDDYDDDDDDDDRFKDAHDDDVVGRRDDRLQTQRLIERF